MATSPTEIDYLPDTTLKKYVMPGGADSIECQLGSGMLYAIRCPDALTGTTLTITSRGWFDGVEKTLPASIGTHTLTGGESLTFDPEEVDGLHTIILTMSAVQFADRTFEIVQREVL